MFSENIGQYMKSKQLSFIGKFVCLAILSANSVYKFSEMYQSYSLNFTTNKQQLFSETTLVEFQYEPVSLDVNKVCFEEGQDIPDTGQNSRKSQTDTGQYSYGK